MRNKKTGKTESQKLFNSLTNVRDDFIYEAQASIISPKSNGRIKKMKLIPIAASFVVVLFSITILASTNWGTQLIAKFTSRTEIGSDLRESGYDLSVGIEKKSFEALNGEIQQVPDLIIQQFKDTDVFSSWYPGYWQKEFLSSPEAIEFIGLKDLTTLKWELKEEEALVGVNGNEQGEILSVRLETRYEVDDISLQAFASIFTENEKDPITYGARTTEDVEFEESYYETLNQVTCHIIRESSLESGYFGLDGFLVKEGILYNLHIAYLAKDKEEAEALLYQWADLF